MNQIEAQTNQCSQADELFLQNVDLSYLEKLET